MRHSFLCAVALLALAPAPRAQVTPAAPLVVMNLAAHPDDEDGATMAYYRHVKNAVVYSVIFTRGEGGQNEIGPELYERLGAIRTAETEAAARILGTQVYYLNFFDFGYSKWASETFAEWSRPRRGFWDTDHPIRGEAAGRDAVTSELVWLIRTLRPDVIFTNHDTVTVGPRAQHGHHQVVGLTARDAFELAADTSYHPEQFEGHYAPGPWQPKRLFVRTSRPADGYDVAVPVGAECGGGETCGDRAVRGAVLHRSQGFDLLAPRYFRRDTTYFRLYRQAADAAPMPVGAADLAAGLSPNPWVVEGTRLNAVDVGRLPSRPGFVAVADSLVVHGQEVDLEWTPFEGHRMLVTGPLYVNNEIDPRAGHASTVVDQPRPTYPRHRYQYDYTRASLRPIYFVTREDPDGSIIELFGGEIGLDVAPPVLVSLAPAPVRVVRGENVVPVSVRTYDPAADAVTVRLRIESTQTHSTSVRPPLHADSLQLAPADTAAVFRFDLPGDAPVGEYRVTVEATASPTSAPAEPYVEIRPAAILPDIRVAEGLRAGFVRSYDLTTENALRAMGADVVPLDSLDLAESRFDGLHTIVLDIRAYLARPDLRRHNQNLLDWVRAGGHLVVGYQKTFEWNAGGPDPTQPEAAGAVNPDFAPYPLMLGRDRVVREDAPVEVLSPNHPFFNTPNPIGEDDWSGWVQERGLYFPQTYDARYRELLAMSDPGEPALRGGLLLTEVGDGTYVYSPLVWYRQLEALNPGAWRLFANIVSLPLADG